MKINQYTTLLVKDRATAYKAAETINSPATAADILRRLYHAGQLPAEQMWQLCLDSKCHVIGAFVLATGNINTCVCDVASIARNALLTGAAGVIIAHNHPSGDPQPSAEDIAATRRAKQALKLFDITLCDHVIIGGGQHHSLKEAGEM